MAAEKRSRSSSPTARYSRSPSSSPIRPSFSRSPVRTTSKSPNSKQQESGCRRSSKNLSIDICKDFTKQRCNRVDCKYAHPPPVVAVEQNKVTVCFDSLRDRCLRGISCCYYHPSSQIRVSLQEAAGIQPSAVRLGYQVDVIRPSNLFFVPPGLPHPLSILTSSSSLKTSTKLAIEVCRDYVRGHCARELDECRYAHHSPTPGQGDYALVCNDHLRGKCERDSCRYFHSPGHLRSRIRHVTVGPAATINSIHCNSSGDAAYTFRLLSYDQQSVKRIRTRDNAGDHLSRGLAYHQYGAPSFQVTAIHGPPLEQAPLLWSPDVAAIASIDEDTLPVCRDFQKRKCSRDSSCKYAHPEPHTKVVDNYVTICWDFKQGKCNRESCRFYHQTKKYDSLQNANAVEYSSPRL